MLRTYLANRDQVSAWLDQTGTRIVAELRDGIGRLALKLQRNVVLDKLQGQVLGKRTGAGANSIVQGVVDEGSKIVGRVSTNLFYMVGWELGWPGRVDKDLAAAKSKFSLASGDMFANGTPKQRSFLRSALADLEASGVIREELDAAVARSIQ